MQTHICPLNFYCKTNNLVKEKKFYKRRKKRTTCCQKPFVKNICYQNFFWQSDFLKSSRLPTNLPIYLPTNYDNTQVVTNIQLWEEKKLMVTKFKLWQSSNCDQTNCDKNQSVKTQIGKKLKLQQTQIVIQLKLWQKLKGLRALEILRSNGSAGKISH